MNYLQIILFVISSRSDNFIVGLSYGTKKIKINFFNNFIIAIISGIGTLLAMLTGNLLTRYIPVRFCKIIGSLLLIILAIYFIADALKTNKRKDQKADQKKVKHIQYYDNILEKPELADIDNSKNIELKEALVLGIALCLNNIGIGIGASIIGMNPFITSALSFLFSFIFIQIGRWLGEFYFSKYFSETAQLISGLIILCLGIFELFV